MRLGLLLFCAVFLSSQVCSKTVPATQFKSMQNFINEMVKKHNFDKNELTTIFHSIKFKITDKPVKKKLKKAKRIKKPPMSWDKYKSLFITESRIENGVKFWQDNSEMLKRAERIYNIPAEIIVAVLGIETNYGNKKGTHPTLETLTKRAFGDYRRGAFYKKELEHFLLMVRENSITPLSVKGSYAGAMGFPQFIASSYRHYAIDFNKDKKVNLFSDPVDAIGSIANYLDKHHWHDDGEIARPVSLDTKHLKYAKHANNKPQKNAQYWRNKGLNISVDINDKTKLAFIRLPQKINDESWLTFWNFYVLTRYNHDNRYAMAVYQLSEKLKQAYDLTTFYEQDTY